MPIQKFSVSRDPDIYEAWPDLVKTPKGKLVCVFTECVHHLDRDLSRIALCESLDRGRTWSEKKYMTPRGTREKYFNNARLSHLSDGRMALICDLVERDENSSSEIWIWYADPEGEVWSEPEILPFCGIVPDKLRDLKSGRRIISAHFFDPKIKKLAQYLWYSDDKGATWSDRITVAADPRYNLCEASILESPDGRLTAFLRENSGKGYPIFKTFSDDGGLTWSPIYETVLDGGHRPVSGWLADGRVMVTYRYIPRGAQNFFAAFFSARSLNETDRSRQSARIMPVDYDRNPQPDLGYSGWTQFDDGEIYVVNYIKDDADKAQIRGYSFYPEDVMLPAKEEK